jgi:hypothetical protein
MNDIASIKKTRPCSPLGPAPGEGFEVFPAESGGPFSFEDRLRGGNGISLASAFQARSRPEDEAKLKD